MAWLDAFFQWFAAFFPRIVVVNTTEGGVKWRLGKEIHEVKPGILIYWPLITETKLYPIARQAVDLKIQTIVTRDDRTIAVGGMIVYDVRDVVALLTSTFEPDQTIKDITASAIHDAICPLSYEEVKEGTRTGTLDRSLKEEAKKQLAPYGVRVIKVTLTDMAPAMVVKVMSAVSQD
jgi:regulator of protease activity HflC (stomatin/prohibitin superfamily)